MHDKGQSSIETTEGRGWSRAIGLVAAVLLAGLLARLLIEPVAREFSSALTARYAGHWAAALTMTFIAARVGGRVRWQTAIGVGLVVAFLVVGLQVLIDAISR